MFGLTDYGYLEQEDDCSCASISIINTQIYQGKFRTRLQKNYKNIIKQYNELCKTDAKGTSVENFCNAIEVLNVSKTRLMSIQDIIEALNQKRVMIFLESWKEKGVKIPFGHFSLVLPFKNSKVEIINGKTGYKNIMTFTEFYKFCVEPCVVRLGHHYPQAWLID